MPKSKWFQRIDFWGFVVSLLGILLTLIPFFVTKPSNTVIGIEGERHQYNEVDVPAPSEKTTFIGLRGKEHKGNRVKINTTPPENN